MTHVCWTIAAVGALSAGGCAPTPQAPPASTATPPDRIPSAALDAYQRAERRLARTDPSCRLRWHLLAAIGRVESDHGQFGGNELDEDGVARPGIYGIPLDGRQGVKRILDTDDGALDRDDVHDRAVGPLQFIPRTWRAVGVDADADGRADPQDIDDAASAAGAYLCGGGRDLSEREDARASVFRYNRSDAYVDHVLGISLDYAAGRYAAVPAR